MDQTKPAIVEEFGTTKSGKPSYTVKLYGRSIFSSGHKGQCDCLAADINTAIRAKEEGK